MDDFTGSFCQQGKYPLLNTINYYLNPLYSTRFLPKSDLLWTNEQDKTFDKKPTHESSFIVVSKNTSLSTNHNVFGILQNDGNLIVNLIPCFVLFFYSSIF
jgi:hypothetical protein